MVSSPAPTSTLAPSSSLAWPLMPMSSSLYGWSASSSRACSSVTARRTNRWRSLTIYFDAGAVVVARVALDADEFQLVRLVGELFACLLVGHGASYEPLALLDDLLRRWRRRRRSRGP